MGRRFCLLSRDRKYRYILRIDLPGTGKPLIVCMHNPSTADHRRNDATVRRLIAFANAMGACYLLIVNRYAYRSTDAVALMQAGDPIGPYADRAIEYACREARNYDAGIVLAWGSYSKYDKATQARVDERTNTVLHILSRNGVHVPHVFAVTKSGVPRHPLYLKRDARPTPWT